MISLQRRLFLLLSTATAIIWLCAAIWIYVGGRSELEHVLDTRLQEAARMVHSLVAGANVAAGAAASGVDQMSYERQLSCQIWSLDGRLLARSSGAPQESMAQDTEGFANQEVNGEAWRIYTIVDAEKGVRVAVGDRIGRRDRLVRDLVAGLIGPAIIMAPMLAVLIWWVLGRGLDPLRMAAAEIAVRDGDDTHPVNTENGPEEIKPLFRALNGLFAKVEASRRHERDITAFAAHELRTPLAGLKTQAQIAVNAQDGSVREGALRQIVISVDRASRLTRQLLALARLESASEDAVMRDTDVMQALGEVIAACPARPDIEIKIDESLTGVQVTADAGLLHLVLRNLHENALDHARSRIIWRGMPDGSGIEVLDDGPGVDEDELLLVTRRFYRGRNKSVSGSGLGLTIAEMAARRFRAGIELANSAETSGLSVRLRWS